MNSLKHGLLSQEALLPHEDPTELAELGERLRKEFNPIGELESVLVDRIIGLAYRLRRLGKIEAGVLSWRYYGVLAMRAAKKAAQHSRLVPSFRVQQTTEVLDDVEYQKALSEQRNYETVQASETATLGEAFVEDSRRENALTKLSRYETSLERSLFKALHELQQLQAVRQEKKVPVPLTLDIDVGGNEHREVNGPTEPIV